MKGNTKQIVMIVHQNPEYIKKVNRKPEMFFYAKELYVSDNSRVKFLFYIRAKVQESGIFVNKNCFLKIVIFFQVHVFVPIKSCAT